MAFEIIEIDDCPGKCIVQKEEKASICYHPSIRQRMELVKEIVTLSFLDLALTKRIWNLYYTIVLKEN